MTADEYIQSIVKKYRITETIDSAMWFFVINPLEEIIKRWAGEFLSDITISGSRAKGTAITLSSDLDLFISLKSSTNNTLKEIYYSLYEEVTNRKIEARKQNVSIGVNFGGHSIDLVPAKKHSSNTNYHSIYRSKADSWAQTNINAHINLIKGSGRLTEIIALKIWRTLHNLEFPSIYLELTVLDALSYKDRNQPSRNLWTVLEYLCDEFVDKIIIDPANTNNIISDELYKYEKQAIANKAKESLSQQFWERIIW